MANDALNDNLIFRPGFQVVNVRCIVIVAEFKPKSRNSAVKSNLVKLGKQMKLVYNDLIEKRVPKPITYRLLCQGKNLHTYGMTKLSEATLCRNIEESDLLSVFICKLVQVKNITIENVRKVEDYISIANSSMHYQPCNSRESWLSYRSFRSSRSSKKKKRSDNQL
ncbi:hypothetical protein EDC96DRAFT_143342 [Choanephora cucurbitarum]|nr:hypothetical protein EDC96DRAFT_143342 [Choanephora cucurbitarum]